MLFFGMKSVYFSIFNESLREEVRYRKTKHISSRFLFQLICGIINCVFIKLIRRRRGFLVAQQKFIPTNLR
jgi:hypothetical protein